MLWRWGVLYPLYFIAESGIMCVPPMRSRPRADLSFDSFTDLAELLGSAIALNLCAFRPCILRRRSSARSRLIPALPLWGGVLLSTADAFLILLFFNGYGSGATTSLMRCFEVLLAVLVLVVFVSFTVLLVKIGPHWADVFHGYLPTHGVVANGALYIAVGIVGATVMPHAIFLGSRIATMDRLGSTEPDALRSAASDESDEGQPAGRRSSFSSLSLRSAEWCGLHIAHASFDVGISLLTIAISSSDSCLIARRCAHAVSQPSTLQSSSSRLPPSSTRPARPTGRAICSRHSRCWQTGWAGRWPTCSPSRCSCRARRPASPSRWPGNASPKASSTGGPRRSSGGS